MPSIQVMRWLDLVQPIFEEGVCSPTSQAVLISCYSLNIGTVFTEKFGHTLPSLGNPRPHLYAAWGGYPRSTPLDYISGYM